MRQQMVVVVLIALAGCAGVQEDGKPAAAQASFQLSGPAGPVKVLNGGPPVPTPVEVHWKRGTPEDVELSVAVEPPSGGVSARVEPAVIAAGEGTAQVIISCSE